MTTIFASWLHRAVLCGLLLCAYLWVWAPLRTAWIAHGATPLLQTVVNATESPTRVIPRPDVQTVRLPSDATPTFAYTAPAGVRFLLPAGALILIAPFAPRLGSFLAGHLGLNGLALGLLAAHVGGLPGSLETAQFIQTYAVDAYSLSVPALVVARQHAFPPFFDP